jgi:hypothetical protein
MFGPEAEGLKVRPSARRVMDLSIVIVSWNSERFLIDCVSSILSSVRGLAAEIIVVDNASSDGSCQILEEHFPEVKLIRLAENIGFPRANNLGFEHSSGECVLFLNPDTEVIGSAINSMHSVLTSSPGIGAVGCRLLNSDGSLQTSCIMPLPTIFNQVLDIEWLKLRCPGLTAWGIKPLFARDDQRPAEVEAISGACIMLKRAVFEKVGLFSTDYFMFSEDIDLCDKVGSAGWKLCYVAGATITHHLGQSSKHREEDAFRIVAVRESMFRFFRKTRGVRYAHLYRMALLAMASARIPILALLLALPLPGIGRTAVRGSLKKWRKILTWSVGLEGWAARLQTSPDKNAVTVRG